MSRDSLIAVKYPHTNHLADIQAYLKQLNGQGTVPHVYIKQDFIGGCSDLEAISASDLKKRIQA